MYSNVERDLKAGSINQRRAVHVSAVTHVKGVRRHV